MSTRARTYAELRATPTEALISMYDEISKDATLGLYFFRDEIARRESEATTAEIARMTRTMRNLTWVVVVLTAINLALVALSVLN